MVYGVNRGFFMAAAVLFFFMLAGMSRAADGGSGHPTDNRAASVSAHAFELAAGLTLHLAPKTMLHKPYIADPLRPATAFANVYYSDSQIPDSGSSRFVARMGGSAGLLRLCPGDNVNSGFQINLEGAFLGMFDRGHSLDNIGWDGLYGVNLSWANGKSLSARVGFLHDSSHVGDEYAERTGQQRIDYTRQEYIAGVSLAPLRFLRFYTECGWAFEPANEDTLDRWRIQGGIEIEKNDMFLDGHAGCYAALDVTAYEESDWEPDYTLQAGVVLPVAGASRTYRFGVEYRDGRSVIGEFSRFEERYIALGFWIDV